MATKFDSRSPSPGGDGGGGQTGRTTTIMEVSVSTTTGPNRRTILCGLAAALAAPGALAACSSDPGEFQPGTPSATPGSGTTAGAARRWPRSRSGGGTIVTKGEQTILLVQPTAGTVKGFDASCPHQGTTVDPPQNGVITCPNHFSQFDGATGALRKGPAATGLTEVPVRVVDGSVQV